MQIDPNLIPRGDMTECHRAQDKEQRNNGKDDSGNDPGHHATQPDALGFRRDPRKPNWAHRSTHHATEDPPDDGGDQDR
ncbi:MAG TPA: hypothetical protein VHU42_00875, partial [Rhodopila sp.]|nr:hypothetical protein [Rhodopila sp.]